MYRIIEQIKMKPVAERRRIALLVTGGIALILLIILGIKLRQRFIQGNTTTPLQLQTVKHSVENTFESYKQTAP